MTSTSPRIKKPARTLLWALLDVLLVNASLFLAQVVRYSSNISYSFFENSIRLAPAMTVIFLLVFCGFGMYRTMWQYASANDVLRIALATLVASLITYLFSLAANAFVRPQNLFRLHRMVYLLFWIISMAMVGASRLLYRIVVTRERFALLSTPRDDVRRVMVVGAGWAGASIVHEMQRGSYGNRAPVLVVDDDRIRTGSELSGVPVVRGSGNILKLASDYRVDEIIIAIATPKGDLKPLIEKCLATGCRVRRLALPARHQHLGVVRMECVHAKRHGIVPGPDHGAFVQQAAAKAFVDSLHAHHAVMVEGGKQHPFQHASSRRFFHTAALQIRIVNQAVFKLHIHVKPRRCQQLQHLPECGNGSVGILRKGLVEAQVLELAQGHPGDEPLAVGAAVHRFIMRHYQMSVRRDMHIQFHTVRALLDRQLKGFQRVFRRIAGSAAMCVNILFHVRSFLSLFAPSPVAARSCRR